MRRLKPVVRLLFGWLAFFLFLQLPVAAQENWTLRKNDKGIQVYSRKTDSFRINELRVTTVMQAKLSQLVAAITDIQEHEKWVYKALNTKLLKRNSATDLFYYTEVDAPWPFDNRDVVMRMLVEQDAKTKVVTIHTLNVDNVYPFQKDIVRILVSRGKWSIMPVSTNQLQIEYRIQVDPGTGVPAWLINFFATNGPYETFLHLREHIKLPKYAEARLDYLVN